MNIIVILIVVMVVAIIFIGASSGMGDKKDKRQNYLASMAKFLEASLEKMEGSENSFFIKFVYKGREFFYEDIEEYGVKKSVLRGTLKAKTPFDLNLSFTERSRAGMREGMSSIQDVTNPWMQNVGKVMSPTELKEFTVHTNNVHVANALLSDEQIVKILVRYKNVGARGHPTLSMEIIGGVLMLRFHPAGDGLTPSFSSLQDNVTGIEEYLNKFLVILDKLQKLKDEEVK